MENEGLVRLVRDAGEEAYVRPEWVDEWLGNGWKVEEAKPAEPEPAPAETKGKAGKSDA